MLFPSISSGRPRVRFRNCVRDRRRSIKSSWLYKCYRTFCMDCDAPSGAGSTVVARFPSIIYYQEDCSILLFRQDTSTQVLPAPKVTLEHSLASRTANHRFRQAPTSRKVSVTYRVIYQTRWQIPRLRIWSYGHEPLAPDEKSKEGDIKYLGGESH